jgi:DNA-binding MarR family transcriptional regulator
VVRWLTPAEDRAWRGYRRMRTLLDLRLARDLAAESGLSETDYDVLSTLSEAPGDRWRASELAARLLWSSSRLAHHVGRMERRGLVARAAVDSDGRGAEVVLTARGRQVLEEAAPGHLESVRRHLVDLLTPTEVDTLAAIAAKVVRNLEADSRPPTGPPERAPGPSR